MYSSKLQNVFVHITKCICQNCSFKTRAKRTCTTPLCLRGTAKRCPTSKWNKHCGQGKTNIMFLQAFWQNKVTLFTFDKRIWCSMAMKHSPFAFNRTFLSCDPIFRHCVQESWGAELHKDLKVERLLLTRQQRKWLWFHDPLLSPQKLTSKCHFSILREVLMSRFTRPAGLFTRESTRILTPTRPSLITLSLARPTSKSW